MAEGTQTDNGAAAALKTAQAAIKTANETAAFARKILHRLETYFGFDIDGDGVIGKYTEDK